MRTHLLSLALAALAICTVRSFAADSAILTAVEPTPFFPKPAEGQPLQQLAHLHLNNPGVPFAATVRVTLGSRSPETRNIQVAKGKSAVAIRIPDIAAPTPVKIELVAGDGRVLAVEQQNWQPQKKWTLFCCSYSHQDLGYGDYPHRLRTSIRHENIRLPLRFCRETDDRPEASRYRFNVETSEPITSFISFHGKEAARELAQRIREGRIALGGLHNTANTEQLSPELLARLFYMSGRHAVDLLGVPAGKTMQNDDVIGLTWPLATYGAEADCAYLYHGYNPCGHCLQPAEGEPVFYWQGPDGGRLLVRSSAYGGYAGDSPGNCSEAHILTCIQHLGAGWPYDALLLQEGTDFQLATRHVADHVHAWNAKYAWPRMVSSTMAMFFDAIARQGDPARIKTFAADANNQWSDQDYAAARASGEARRLNASLPATETLASVAQALAGGGDQWINTFQSYHRLLQYWEHTNAKSSPKGNMTWYETELEENREMVAEAAAYRQQVFASASRRIASVVTRTGEKNLIVFNPLPCRRTDVVRIAIPAEGVVDPATGATRPVQQLPDGSSIFVAEDVPATGYKTYELVGSPRPAAGEAAATMESRFYRVEVDRATGAIASLYDKRLAAELVEKQAPHAFNQYLYEYRTHTAGLDHDSVWSRMEKADAVQIVRGPVADVLTVTGRAEGVRQLRQTVILYRDLPRLDFGIWLDKAPMRGRYQRNHEAVFAALPLAVPNFTIRHELPGAVIEPYRQQFAGSATDHFAIQGFTDLSSDRFGVTVSPIEGSLVCYGEPISSPMLLGQESHFLRDQAYPAHSRLYLYLLNNMFDVNIAFDQRGPVEFRWALASHPGDWRSGGAVAFGRGVQQPLVAWPADGKQTGRLPGSASFLSVEPANVTLSVLKPAEANSRGYILRLNETAGRETTATVSLPMLPSLESVKEVSLVENDRRDIAAKGNAFDVVLPKFGVKTFRVTCAAAPIAASGLRAEAVADMQVNLAWRAEGDQTSHYNIYRDTDAACPATPLNFIGQSAGGEFIDRPEIHLGGWLRSCLTPKTTYYYRIIAVDWANNPGTPSAAVTVTTPSSAEANLPPVSVEGLRAILVSPISRDNFVNLLFRTACEPDVTQYEIHRGTSPGFAAEHQTLVGVIHSDDIPVRSGGYGEQWQRYTVREYDHATFADTGVPPATTYYYKVRAVDAAGQRGGLSEEVAVQTKEAPGCKITAQSVYAPEYAPELAIDGDPDPYQAWISKPYGGGTKARPQDVWWAVEFGKSPLTLAGVKIIGDHREVIPLQKRLRVDVREGGAWRTAGELKDASTKDVEIRFARPVTTDALRVFVPAADLPASADHRVDGIVRICELRLILPDGTETGVDTGPTERPAP